MTYILFICKIKDVLSLDIVHWYPLLILKAMFRKTTIGINQNLSIICKDFTKWLFGKIFQNRSRCFPGIHSRRGSTLVNLNVGKKSITRFQPPEIRGYFRNRHIERLWVINWEHIKSRSFAVTTDGRKRSVIGATVGNAVSHRKLTFWYFHNILRKFFLAGVPRNRWLISWLVSWR